MAGHTCPEVRGLCLPQQPVAKDQHGVQPITASDSAQLMPVSNELPKLSLTAIFKANLRKSLPALLRAISESLLRITSGLLTTPLYRYHDLQQTHSPSSYITKQQIFFPYSRLDLVITLQSTINNSARAIISVLGH